MKYTLTDRLMWHFMQGTCYKVLRAEYPEWDFHQLRKAAKERFSDILTSTPSIGSYRENSLKKNLVGGMVWFAIYETACRIGSALLAILGIEATIIGCCIVQAQKAHLTTT